METRLCRMPTSAGQKLSYDVTGENHQSPEIFIPPHLHKPLLLKKCLLFSWLSVSVRPQYFSMPEPAKSTRVPKKGFKKAVTKAPKKDGKKRKRSRKQSYSVYVCKVLKQVHPDTGISSKAMGIMNLFANDIFERIAGEASRLAHYARPSHPGRSRRLFACRCLESWPSTQCMRVPRLSPSIPAPSKCVYRHCQTQRLFSELLNTSQERAGAPCLSFPCGGWRGRGERRRRRCLCWIWVIFEEVTFNPNLVLI